MTTSDDGSDRRRDVFDAVAAMLTDLTLGTLLERILRMSAELAGARHGHLVVVDRRSDRRLGSVAWHGADPRGLAAAEDPALVTLRDLVDDPTQRLAPPVGDARADALTTTVVINGYDFARIALTGPVDAAGFRAADSSTARALAVASAIVIENARLHDHGERQSRWLDAAAELTSVVLEPRTRTEVLQLVVDHTRALSGADASAVLLPTASGALRVEAMSGEVTGAVGQEVAADGSVAGDVARSRRSEVVGSVDREPRYAPHVVDGWPDLGTVLVLPLGSGDDTGALLLGWARGRKTDRWELDPAMPQRFADQAAVVLALLRSQDDRDRLALADDRDRIGRDLHDVVIQRLFAVGLMLDSTSRLVDQPEVRSRLTAAVDELDDTIKDIRRTIFELGTGQGSVDLRTELANVIEHAEGLLGFRPQLRLSGPVDSVVPEDVREHLLAVLGEALSNIVRHAQARHVTVELTVNGGIELVVTDDGRGLSDAGVGSGLRNMRHRAALLGGHCEVRSADGDGVAVRWTVPAVGA